MVPVALKLAIDSTTYPLQIGLTSLADTVVGGSVGQGLSGGQKRRLCVALQMINLPSVLFLDEPTSGTLFE